jgi:hypothetical protein
MLNPKVTIFYLSVLPQFVDPTAGSVLSQTLYLGSTQVVIGSSVNLLITLSAAGVASWFAHRPLWLLVQRYLMGTGAGRTGSPGHFVTPCCLTVSCVAALRMVHAGSRLDRDILAVLLRRAGFGDPNGRGATASCRLRTGRRARLLPG